MHLIHFDIVDGTGILHMDCCACVCYMAEVESLLLFCAVRNPEIASGPKLKVEVRANLLV